MPIITDVGVILLMVEMSVLVMVYVLTLITVWALIPMLMILPILPMSESMLNQPWVVTKLMVLCGLTDESVHVQ